MRTKNISDPISSMSTEIRELSVDELAAASGGLELGPASAVIYRDPEKQNLQDIYQHWADQGTFLKNQYGRVA